MRKKRFSSRCLTFLIFHEGKKFNSHVFFVKICLLVYELTSKLQTAQKKTPYKKQGQLVFCFCVFLVLQLLYRTDMSLYLFILGPFVLINFHRLKEEDIFYLETRVHLWISFFREYGNLL